MSKKISELFADDEISAVTDDTHFECEEGAASYGCSALQLKAYIGSGSGDVTGPASSTDNAVARYDSTTGKIIQDSGVIIDDSDNITGAQSIALGTPLDISSGGTGAATASAARVALELEIGVDVQGYDADTVKSDVATSFTAQQNFGAATLTDGATINWNLATQQSAKVTLGGNRTMAAPTNLVDGGTYRLEIIQDGTGSRTITWNSVFKWAGGTPPTLSSGAGEIDIIFFDSDGTNLRGVMQGDFS